jgi:hypothetical protein
LGYTQQPIDQQKGYGKTSETEIQDMGKLGREDVVSSTAPGS